MRCRSRALGSSTLQLPPKTLTPSQNASKSVQIADRSASQQNMYEEDDLRLPPSTGSIIVATAVGSSEVRLITDMKRHQPLGRGSYKNRGPRGPGASRARANSSRWGPSIARSYPCRISHPPGPRRIPHPRGPLSLSRLPEDPSRYPRARLLG